MSQSITRNERLAALVTMAKVELSTLERELKILNEAIADLAEPPTPKPTYPGLDLEWDEYYDWRDEMIAERKATDNAIARIRNITIGWDFS